MSFFFNIIGLIFHQKVKGTLTSGGRKGKNKTKRQSGKRTKKGKKKMRKVVTVLTLVLWLVFASGLAVLAGPLADDIGCPPNPQLNLSHIKCVDYKVEIHFVLLNVPEGVTPGTLFYTYGSIPPGSHTGNVWHYTDYKPDGYYDITWANVLVGTTTVSLHNPSTYVGDYLCSYWGIFVECVDPGPNGYYAELGYKWDGAVTLALDRSDLTPGNVTGSVPGSFEPGRHVFPLQINHLGNEVWTVKALGRTKTTTASPTFPKRCYQECSQTVPSETKREGPYYKDGKICFLVTYQLLDAKNPSVVCGEETVEECVPYGECSETITVEASRSGWHWEDGRMCQEVVYHVLDKHTGALCDVKTVKECTDVECAVGLRIKGPETGENATGAENRGCNIYTTGATAVTLQVHGEETWPWPVKLMVREVDPASFGEGPVTVIFEGNPFSPPADAQTSERHNSTAPWVHFEWEIEWPVAEGKIYHFRLETKCGHSDVYVAVKAGDAYLKLLKNAGCR